MNLERSTQYLDLPERHKERHSVFARINTGGMEIYEQHLLSLQHQLVCFGETIAVDMICYNRSIHS